MWCTGGTIAFECDYRLLHIHVYLSAAWAICRWSFQTGVGWENEMSLPPSVNASPIQQWNNSLVKLNICILYILGQRHVGCLNFRTWSKRNSTIEIVAFSDKRFAYEVASRQNDALLWPWRYTYMWRQKYVAWFSYVIIIMFCPYIPVQCTCTYVWRICINVLDLGSGTLWYRRYAYVCALTKRLARWDNVYSAFSWSMCTMWCQCSRQTCKPYAWEYLTHVYSEDIAILCSPLRKLLAHFRYSAQTWNSTRNVTISRFVL